MSYAPSPLKNSTKNSIAFNEGEKLCLYSPCAIYDCNLLVDLETYLCDKTKLKYLAKS